MAKKLIVVCGPTASGKTRLGIEIAKALDGEVISADSMQVYRGMDIGTAKPAMEERQGIPHHMLDVAEPWENYSVARYARAAAACADDIMERGRRAIVVGGTGLYIDALLKGHGFADFDPEGGHRLELLQRVREEGLSALWAELQRVDPEAAGRLHPNDEKRIVRALEVWQATGKTISSHNRETKQMPPRYQAAVLGLNFIDRENLRARIDRRVDEMMARGLVGEVEGLLARGIPQNGTAMQAIGYKELAACLTAGGDLAAAAEEIKLRSRQYAKRQLTWFRRSQAVHWHLWEESPDFSIALQDSIQFLHREGLG